MKNFLRRLRIYGLGFGIGLVFVFFFFQNRGCTWLPGNRVKNTILGRVIVVSDDQQKLLRANGISPQEAVQFLNDGDIRFGHSKKAGNPQVYSVTREINGKEVELWFTLPRESYISEIQWPEGTIQSAGNTKKGTGKMIHFPNAENFVYLDETPVFKCQLKETGFQNEKTVQSRIKASGRIDFEKSRLTVDEKSGEKATERILFTNAKGLEIEADTKWLEDHIQLSYFIVKDSLSCPSN